MNVNQLSAKKWLSKAEHELSSHLEKIEIDEEKIHSSRYSNKDESINKLPSPVSTGSPFTSFYNLVPQYSRVQSYIPGSVTPFTYMFTPSLIGSDPLDANVTSFSAIFGDTPKIRFTFGRGGTYLLTPSLAVEADTFYNDRHPTVMKAISLELVLEGFSTISFRRELIPTDFARLDAVGRGFQITVNEGQEVYLTITLRIDFVSLILRPFNIESVLQSLFVNIRQLA